MFSVYRVFLVPLLSVVFDRSNWSMILFTPDAVSIRTIGDDFNLGTGVSAENRSNSVGTVKRLSVFLKQIENLPRGQWPVRFLLCKHASNPFELTPA